MFQQFVKKGLIVILSTIILSFLLSFIAYTPAGRRLDDTEYMSFMALFLVYGMFILPAYVVFGLGFSNLIDRFRIERVKTRIYALTGIAAGAMMYIIFGPAFEFMYLIEFFGFMIFGCMASLLFLFFQQIFDRIVFKKGTFLTKS